MGASLEKGLWGIHRKHLPSYSDSPEDSNEEADDDEDQEYEEHDL